MATASAKQTFKLMRDEHLTTRDRAEDIRSHKVIDAAGQDIGVVEGLLIDDQDEKIRFLRVASGGFLGMGRSKVLIPVEAITKLGRNVVHIDQTRERVATAPEYSPELVDERYYESLYGYYGYQPFWGAGYVYPPYPYYADRERLASNGPRHDGATATK